MLTSKEAKRALDDVIESLKTLDHDPEMQEAHRLSGCDMLRRMQLVYPRQCLAQMTAIARHGFSADADGLVKFAQAVAWLAKEDPDVSELSQRLRRICIPPLGTEAPSIS